MQCSVSPASRSVFLCELSFFSFFSLFRSIAAKCTSLEFTCADGMCIPYDLVCNGAMNCWNGKDEVICREILSLSLSPPLPLSHPLSLSVCLCLSVSLSVSVCLFVCLSPFCLSGWLPSKHNTKHALILPKPLCTICKLSRLTFIPFIVKYQCIVFCLMLRSLPLDFAQPLRYVFVAA